MPDMPAFTKEWPGKVCRLTLRPIDDDKPDETRTVRLPAVPLRGMVFRFDFDTAHTWQCAGVGFPDEPVPVLMHEVMSFDWPTEAVDDQ